MPPSTSRQVATVEDEQPEDFREVQPAVDAVGLETVQPGACRALKHEGDVLHGNAPVAVCRLLC